MTFNPMLFSFSAAADEALEGELLSAGYGTPGVGGGSKLGEGSLGVDALPELGCLKIPKFIDFFSGRMLQDIVWCSLTFTHRTRYDLVRHQYDSISRWRTVLTLL